MSVETLTETMCSQETPKRLSGHTGGRQLLVWDKIIEWAGEDHGWSKWGESSSCKGAQGCWKWLSQFGTSESWQSNSKVPTAPSLLTFFRQVFSACYTPILVPSLFPLHWSVFQNVKTSTDWFVDILRRAGVSVLIWGSLEAGEWDGQCWCCEAVPQLLHYNECKTEWIRT